MPVHNARLRIKAPRCHDLHGDSIPSRLHKKALIHAVTEGFRVYKLFWPTHSRVWCFQVPAALTSLKPDSLQTSSILTNLCPGTVFDFMASSASASCDASVCTLRDSPSGFMLQVCIFCALTCPAQIGLSAGRVLLEQLAVCKFKGQTVLHNNKHSDVSRNLPRNGIQDHRVLVLLHCLPNLEMAKLNAEKTASSPCHEMSLPRIPGTHVRQVATSPSAPEPGFTAGNG